MTRPFRWYNQFWTCDLHRDLWPTFKNFNIGQNFFILRDGAFIFDVRFLWQVISDSAINFENVTFTVTFDLHLKKKLSLAITSLC